MLIVFVIVLIHHRSRHDSLGKLLMRLTKNLIGLRAVPRLCLGQEEGRACAQPLPLSLVTLFSPRPRGRGSIPVTCCVSTPSCGWEKRPLAVALITNTAVCMLHICVSWQTSTRDAFLLVLFPERSDARTLLFVRARATWT